MKLYSLDLGTEQCVEVQDQNIGLPYIDKKMANRSAKQELWEKRNKYKIAPYHIMTADEDWRELRQTLERPFQIKTQKLLIAYQTGDWK